MRQNYSLALKDWGILILPYGELWQGQTMGYITLVIPCDLCPINGLVRHNPGAGFTFQRRADMLGISDQRLFTAGFEEPDNRLDLGRH